MIIQLVCSSCCYRNSFSTLKRLMLLLLLFLSSNSHARFTCLNSNSDPKNAFYAEKLDNIVNYITEVEQKFKTLRARNLEISRRMNEINEKVLPNLRRQLDTQEDSILFRELQNANVELSRSQTQAQRQRDERNRQSRLNYQREKRELDVQLARLKTFESNIAAEFNKRLDDSMVRRESINLKYNNQIRNARSFYDNQRSSSVNNRSERSSARSTLEAINSESQIEINQMEEKRNQELRRLDAEIQIAERQQLESIRRLQIQQEEVQSKLTDLKVRYESELQNHTNSYNQQRQRAQASQRRALSRVANPISNEISRIEQELQNLEKEFDENVKGKPKPKSAPPTTQTEKNLEFHGIEQIEANLGKFLRFDPNGNPIFDSSGKFEFVKRWWKEQGEQKRKEKQQTEAQAIIECKWCLPSLPEVKMTPELSRACVDKSISRLSANTTQYRCEDTNGGGRETRNECVTDELADYTQWSINNALKCISPKEPSQNINPNIIALKINRESNFNSSYCWNGGCGLLQTTTCARDEMMGCNPSPHCCNPDDSACRARARCNNKSSGRKFLADTFNSNNQLLSNIQSEQTNPCTPYKNIFDFETESDENQTGEMDSRRLFREGFNNKCQTLSLEEGIHRNIINGLGLYLFYRDSGSNSATQLVTNHLGINESNSDFNKIRDYFTLAMYGRNGNTGAESALRASSSSLKRKMRDGKLTFEEFKEELQKRVPYLKEINDSANKSFLDIGGGDPQCAL